jgi:hypothetical protein
MTITKIESMDIEPLWVDMIPLFLDMKDKSLAKSELTKIAVIADKIRQAQKNKEMLVFDFTDKGDNK